MFLRPHADRAGGCGAPAWGITPGCSFLGFPTRSRAGFAPGILCLSALGVPYAGGELAHRGFYPTTCPLFNKKEPPKQSIVRVLYPPGKTLRSFRKMAPRFNSGVFGNDNFDK